MSDAALLHSSRRLGVLVAGVLALSPATAVLAEVAVLDGEPESVAEESIEPGFRADLHQVGDGRWVLHGTAPNLEVKRETVRAIERTKPDDHVLDRLHVVDPDLLPGATAGDDELAVAVRLRLGEEELGHVGVASVHAATVLLQGEAESDTERRLAVRIASEVPGVEAVYGDAITSGSLPAEPERAADTTP